MVALMWHFGKRRPIPTSTQPPPPLLSDVARTHGERLFFGSVVNRASADYVNMIDEDGPHHFFEEKVRKVNGVTKRHL